MRKRIELAQNKDELHNLGSDDLLSRLPDEILVSIVSKLPLRDAVVTSKLSRRWRYLCCQTDRLLFEDCGKRWRLMHAYSSKQINKYMSWVDHIIHQHNGPTIDKFKICFGLDENAKDAINKWIKYAISKNVQTLELSLVRSHVNYCFPNESFDWKCGSSLKGHSFNNQVMEIKCLKSLVLNHVDVDDEGLKKVLSNCPVLENLFIRDSCKLVKPEIHGKGLALKNLYMISCYGLETVELCDSNIVFFSCRGGSPITLRFDNLQKLEKICIDKGHSWKELHDMFCQISCIPYLHVLELNLYRVQGAIELHPFPMLQKLKQLTVKVVEREDDGFLMLPYLLEACPNLRRLTIVRTAAQPGLEETNREVKQMDKKVHQHLEVVKMVGYHGWTSDFELFMYFIQNCIALKKLVIEPTMGAKKNGAKYYVHQTPGGVELVIL